MRRQTDKQKWSQTDSWAGKQTGRLHRSRCADSREADDSSGGDFCIKVIGMLVVSLRGVTFRIWSYLEYLGWKGIILAHSCQLSLRAVHKEIYKEMPWQSSFRGQLKLQSHPPWFPLGINFNFPTSIPLNGRFPPGSRHTDSEHTEMHTADRQTNKRRKGPADMQTTWSRETDNQTEKKQRYRQQRSRQAHSRTWTSRQREADLLPSCLPSARLQQQGISRADLTQQGARHADNCIPQKANKQTHSHGRRHRPQFIAEKQAFACRHADLQASKQPTRRQADRRHGFESC